MSQRQRGGFTLVELLVAIAVIALLLAIAIPAVQQAREAARRIQCKNNLRQLGMAMLEHETAFRQFPSNGWGFEWIGVPDRGTDKRQPGGWIYNILPFLEQENLRDLGQSEPLADQRQTLSQLMQTPMPVVKCPSRPGDQVAPANPSVVPRNAEWVPDVAKTDYACNEGDYITDTRGGPASLDEGDSGGYIWRDTRKATGICFQRSEIRIQDIRDGASNTYLLGEKYVSTTGYNTSDDPGHDQSLYSGVDLDLNRWTIEPPMPDGEAIGIDAARHFGSAHAGACHFVFCDGSVRSIDYAIDREVHRRQGNRKDMLAGR